MALLEVDNLTKHYQLPSSKESVRALDGVSLSVDPGEIVGVVGESGCGKTTLGRCILRLIEPTSGTVRFRGSEVGKLNPADLRSLRRRMQIVFQDPYASLDPRWRIDEILDEPLRVHSIVPKSERKAEIARLLTDVGLPEDSAYRYPHEFSGGQRQRIGIARALALRPEFLIADEPVSALDVSIRAQILNLLLSLQKDKSIAIIFIGHDLGVVRQISRKIAVMHMGVIVEEAAADVLFENPRHPYTRALLSAIPSINNIGKPGNFAEKQSGDTPPTIGSTTGCRYRSRCTFAQEKCKTEMPRLTALATEPGHLAACHFKNELPQFELMQRVKAA